MTYDVTIRHSEHMGREITHDHRVVEADDELDLLEHIRFTGVFDGVSEIRPIAGSRLMEFSVDTGHVEFPSKATMPDGVHMGLEVASDFEARLG